MGGRFITHSRDTGRHPWLENVTLILSYLELFMLLIISVLEGHLCMLREAVWAVSLCVT